MTTGLSRLINTNDANYVEGERYAKRVAQAKIGKIVTGLPCQIPNSVPSGKNTKVLENLRTAQFKDSHEVQLVDQAFKYTYPFHIYNSLIMLRKIYGMVLNTKEPIEVLEGDFCTSVKAIVSKLLARYSHFSKEEALIKNIRKGLEHNGYLMIGGTQGHAILFVKEKDALTVYNSGNGSFQKDEASHLCHSVKYSNLTKDQLSPAFFRKLKHFSEYENDMTKVNDFLKQSLSNPAVSNVSYPSTHKIQNNGTCAFKCLSFYLRDTLGVEEHLKFKLFVTIELRKELLKIIGYKESLGIDLKKMLKDVDEVLKKRMKKVAHYYPDPAKGDAFWKWVEANC